MLALQFATLALERLQLVVNFAELLALDLGGLRDADVELALAVADEPTGVALIYVDTAGETEIVVAPGARFPFGMRAG